MRLRNKIIMAPLGTNLADASGAVTRQLIERGGNLKRDIGN
jgi:hypothetical protein